MNPMNEQGSRLRKNIGKATTTTEWVQIAEVSCYHLLSHIKTRRSPVIAYYLIFNEARTGRRS